MDEGGWNTYDVQVLSLLVEISGMEWDAPEEWRRRIEAERRPGETSNQTLRRMLGMPT